MDTSAAIFLLWRLAIIRQRLRRQEAEYRRAPTPALREQIERGRVLEQSLTRSEKEQAA